MNMPWVGAQDGCSTPLQTWWDTLQEVLLKNITISIFTID
jgi:hypothetical protein